MFGERKEIERKYFILNLYYCHFLTIFLGEYNI